MKKIQMVDLVTQYEKIKPKIQDAINNILDTAQFINGSDVQEFKKELADYLGVKHVIPCANGTDALQLALMSFELKPGDEIILPSFTYIATAEVVALLRLKPVFVDCEKDSFNISVSAVEKAISERTKVIVPVHLFGQSCDMEPLKIIAEKYNLKIIEDNAQAIGSDYIFSDGTVKKTGTIGDIGCTSFFPSKNLGAYGDGGAIFTDNDELAVKLNMMANHGQSKRYYHDVVGCNSRLDSMQAAILRIKLKELDNYIDARRKSADFYDDKFKDAEGLIIPFRAKNTSHVFHQYTIQLSDGIDRDALVSHLIEREIPAMIYYPVPAHKQKMFGEGEISDVNLDNTNWLSSHVFSIPMHTELEEDQLDYICGTIINYIKINSSLNKIK